MSTRDRRRSAFTLAEMLVVVAIIVVLIAILLPAITRAREQANRLKCASNLAQLGLEMVLYANDNANAFPRTRYTAGSAFTYYTGATSSDPFETGTTVSVNDVTAAMFLLLRTYQFDAALFICPSSSGVPDNSITPLSRSNFANTRNANLSYSIACPYPDSSATKAGYYWKNKFPYNFALMADMNPGNAMSSNNVLAPTPFSPQSVMQLANSNNHNRVGQNVLFGDGHVDWDVTPFVGISNDNIYTRQGSTVITSDTTSPFGPPLTATDSILGVTVDDGPTGGDNGQGFGEY